MAEDAKHTVCRVAESVAAAQCVSREGRVVAVAPRRVYPPRLTPTRVPRSAATAESAPYELPDGTRVDMGCHVHALPELLMDPAPLKVHLALPQPISFGPG